jgi:hypothetical protein
VFTKSTAKSAGSRGGKATFTKHGPTHMRKIAKRGFAVTVERHWKGDREAYTAFLRERGLLKVCDQEFELMLNIYREHGLLF